MTALLPPGGEIFAFLGLGSNLDDRLEHLQAGVEQLHADDKSRVDEVSSVYETAPVGGPAQGPFLNIAVRLATRRSPRTLLKLAHEVEAARDRTRAVRWGPRTLDVDILLYHERVVRSRRLVVPHPRLVERPFALIPLIEVAPGFHLPDGRALTGVLAQLAPVEGVTQIGRQVHLSETRRGRP